MSDETPTSCEETPRPWLGPLLLAPTVELDPLGPFLCVPGANLVDLSDVHDGGLLDPLDRGPV